MRQQAGRGHNRRMSAISETVAQTEAQSGAAPVKPPAGARAPSAGRHDGNAAEAPRREIIIIEVSGQIFGLDIMAIREILAWSPVTRMPGLPSYVAGLANVRGEILPVIDLAARLGWAPTQPGERHAIVVVLIGGQAFGLIVEAVSDLVAFDGALLQPPPALGDMAITSLIEGLAPLNDRMGGDRMAMVLDLAGMADAPAMRGAA